MDPRRDELELADELLALRPTPRSEFATELDARAAAGFPSGVPEDVPRSARLAEWLRKMPRWRPLAVAGAAATATIVVATAVIAISEGGQDTFPDSDRDSVGAARPSVEFSNKPPAAAPDRAAAGAARSGPESGVESGGGSSLQYGEALSTGPVAPTGSPSLHRSPASGPYAAQATKRDVERSAHVVLGADDADLRAAVSRVFETVRSYDGIVMRSSVSEGGDGEAGASFDLLIPSGKLGGALAAFSDIAEVRSRRDSAVDVTAPRIGLEERLRDSRARVEGLLTQLADADTEGERTAVEAELRSERRRLAMLRSSLNGLQRRTGFARVSLRIETGGSTAAADEGWGVAAALDAAGRILAIAAGVAVIGLATLLPLALLGLLAWLAWRTWIRIGRERVLDRAG